MALLSNRWFEALRRISFVLWWLTDPAGNHHLILYVLYIAVTGRVLCNIDDLHGRHVHHSLSSGQLRLPSTYSDRCRVVVRCEDVCSRSGTNSSRSTHRCSAAEYDPDAPWKLRSSVHSYEALHWPAVVFLMTVLQFVGWYRSSEVSLYRKAAMCWLSCSSRCRCRIKAATLMF